MKIEHHGQYIEKIIRRNGYSITDIARLARVNRRSVYNWFNLPRLRPNTIKIIGEAMQCDLSDAFPEIAEYSDNNRDSADTMNCVEQKSYQQIDYWKNKYIELLEKYTELLTLKSEDSLRELI